MDGSVKSIALQSIGSRWENQLIVASVSNVGAICGRRQCHCAQIVRKSVIPSPERQKVGFER